MLYLQGILNHGASMCGMNAVKLPIWHYSGNFCSALCNYIVTLPPTVVPVSAEMWIGIGYPMAGTLASHMKHVEMFE